MFPSVFEERISALVHPSVGVDARENHLRFMFTRLATACAAFCLLPVYLALFGRPSGTEMALFGCLFLPVVAVVILSRTGRLDFAYGVSSLALAGVIVTLALVSGGVRSPVLVWLAAVPLEAFLSRVALSVRMATVVSLASILLVAMLDTAGLATASERWSPYLAIPVFIASAVVYAVYLGSTNRRTVLAQDARSFSHDVRNQAILEAVSDIVTCHDRTGSVSYASNTSEKLIGIPGDKLKGIGLFERVHVADRPAYLKALSDAAYGEKPVSVEMRLHTAGHAGDSGQVIWVEMKAQISTVVSDDVVVVAVMRDMTDRKHYEEELETARQQAEQASHLKDRFLATVTHELRTPLNAIIGFSEILANDGLMVDMTESRRKDYAGIIQSSGHHLLDVVNTLLDMSKIETGNFDLVPEPFNPGDLAASCCDLMQLKAASSGITLRREFDSTLPDITADKRACRQILINLLSNAVKFTKAEGCITVNLRRQGGFLHLSVTDTGIGVSEADLEKLGEPFFQAGPTYNRSYEGTGLGLSVVRGLVGLHAGSMSIESGLGEGTCVRVQLPLSPRAQGGVANAPIHITTLIRQKPIAGLSPRDLSEQVRKRA